MSYDNAVFYWLNGFVGINSYLDTFFVFISDRFFILVLACALFSIFLWRGSVGQKIKIIGAFLLASIFSLGLVFLVFHQIWPRERPFISLEGVRQLVAEEGFSFPSRHATLSFLLAIFVFLVNKKLGVLFLVFAVMISLGRVFVGVHYPSDVLWGAIFGFSVGVLFFRRNILFNK